MKFTICHDTSKKTLAIPRAALQLSGLEDAERLATTTRRAGGSWCVPARRRSPGGYRIPLEHLRWYAAFHRKEDSVHIHMVVFSSNLKEAISPNRASGR